MDEEYLQKIVENTSIRPSFQVVLTGVGSKLEANFTPPLTARAGCSHELALVSLETFYSFGNIDGLNNKFKVFLHDSWEIITIPIGCYELVDINTELQRQILLKKELKMRLNLSQILTL